MITIRLIDARRELSLRCRELFTNERIAKEIYEYLCDGLEECKEVEPERKKGKWIHEGFEASYLRCSSCGWRDYTEDYSNYCPHCGADMRED